MSIFKKGLKLFGSYNIICYICRMILETESKDKCTVYIREDSFEFLYGGIWYRLKDGKLSLMKKNGKK